MVKCTAIQTLSQTPTNQILNASSPLYAEPNWASIGVNTYLDAGNAAGIVTLCLGLVVFGTSFAVVLLLSKELEKQGAL